MNENNFEFLDNIRADDLVTADDKELEAKLAEADAQYQFLCDRYGDDDKMRPLILD